MVVAQERHDVFRVCAFGESGEAAQIAEKRGYLAAMTFELLLGTGRNDQISHLRGQEATQSAHALDFVYLVGDTLFEVLVEFLNFFCSLAQFFQKARVLDGDDSLGGEVLHKFDLLVGEWADFVAI
jgi:hypothetical protein